MVSAVMPTYARTDVAFERGEGAFLIAADGRAYLDFASGIAVTGLGHAHPALVAALTEQGRQLLFCFPNSDAGSRRLIERAAAFCDASSRSRLYVNLDTPTYWALLRESALLLGNSSSGIMEAASLELPAVNVGARQQGRERAANVIERRRRLLRFSLPSIEG